MTENLGNCYLFLANKHVKKNINKICSSYYTSLCSQILSEQLGAQPLIGARNSHIQLIVWYTNGEKNYVCIEKHKKKVYFYFIFGRHLDMCVHISSLVLIYKCVYYWCKHVYMHV